MLKFCIEHAKRNENGKLEFLWVNGLPTKDSEDYFALLEDWRRSGEAKSFTFFDNDNIQKYLENCNVRQTFNEFPNQVTDLLHDNKFSSIASIVPLSEIPIGQRYIYPIFLYSPRYLQLPIFLEKGIFLSERVKQDCREGLCKLLIWDVLEGQGWNTFNYWPGGKSIKKFIQAQHRIHNIPLENIGFADCNFKTPELQNTFGSKGFFYPTYEHQISFRFNNKHDFPILDRIEALTRNNKKPYYFLSLNRRPHNHRIMLGQKIFDRWMDKFLWSLSKFTDIVRNAATNPWADIVEKTISKDFYDFLPAQLDVVFRNEFFHIDTEVGYNIPTQLLDKTYINLVTETKFFESDALFLSEKIFKPISYLQPFIVVGPVNELKTLKSLGYQTFHPFIDESYDSIEDPIERFNAIMSEVDRICSLTHEDMQDLVKKCIPSLLHNYFLRKKVKKEFIREINFVSQLNDWLHV